MQIEETHTEHAMLVTKYVRPERGGALRRDDARNLLRRTLEYHAANGRLTLYAWAFLPSKVSLVIALPTPIPLALTVGDVFGYFTRRLNNRYRHTGAVFRTRFLKKVLSGPDEILAGIAAVHRMPVRKDLVYRPGAEPWSSEALYRMGTDDAITRRYVVPPELPELEAFAG